MKKKLAAVLLCLSLCTALSLPAFAAEETADSSTITVSVTELEPGYYLCAVWRGDTLLRLFDYTVGADGRMEATVEIGEKLETGTQVTVGISNANTASAEGQPIPPVVCTVQNPSADTPGEQQPSGGGTSGSDDSAPSYSIDLPSVTGGTIKAVPARASAGQPVTLTVRPNGGYQLNGLTVTDSRGNEVRLTDRGDGKYTFTMPAGKISLDVRFAEISAVSFRDVPSDAYYADAVAWAVKKGITAGTGDNAFSPDAPCTRAQIVTFLWRAAGSPAAGGDSRFTDVDPGAYYCDAVAWAVANGITSGTGGDTFSPDAVCTRSQAVTLLYRAGGSPAVSGGSAFTDVAEGMYYTDAVRWAVSEGITAGTGASAFSPDADCTRAQIVTFLYRDMA